MCWDQRNRTFYKGHLGCKAALWTPEKIHPIQKARMMFMHQLRLSLAFKQDLTMNFMIHWLCTGSCHRDTFLSHPHHVPYITMTIKLWHKLQQQHFAFSSFIIKSLKNPYNLYTALASIIYFTFSPGSFQFHAVLLLFFFITKKPPTKTQRQK